MTDNSIGDEIVTKFLANTCRLRPRPSKRAVQAAVMCAAVASYHPQQDADAEYIPTITGSVAEFYIEPMLPHVGDVDIMHHINSRLAIPRGHPPPRQLPAEFHDYVKVGEIIDSHWPGYVYLKFRYLLTKCVDNDSYSAIKYDTQLYMTVTHNFKLKFEAHGPARMPPRLDKNHLSMDLVPCVRCLSWPSQAAGWSSRHRNYEWPDSATVDRVVSNGCDVVGVVHRQCRQDKLMSRFQWRLSFSRTESVLLNSWTPVQQIVYHLLRVYMKSEQLTESANNSQVRKLNNYHIKTLMLWACELKPKSKSWWTVDFSVIKICVGLFHTLAVWLTETRLPHYFISSCNLVDESLDLEMIANRLLLIDNDCLSSWLVDDYIRQSVRVCPESISQLFDEVGTKTKIENAISAVVSWRLNAAIRDLFSVFYFAEFQITSGVSVHSLSPWSCMCWMNELSKIDVHLSMFFSAIAFLHVVKEIKRRGLLKNLIMSLSVITNQLIVSSNYYNELTFSLLSKVLTLIGKCDSPADRNTAELVELLQQSAVELLTTFRRSMARDTSPVATVVTTDFEAIYAYKCGDYQRCLQLSTQNIRTVWNCVNMTDICTYMYPELIQLLDDDIVSLTALTLIVNPACRYLRRYVSIIQLTLSLYLMTQCQLKLRHSLTSLAQTLDYIEVAQRRILAADWTLDQLTVKLAEHKLLTYITTRNNIHRHN